MRRKDGHDGRGQGGRRGDREQVVVRQVGQVETGSGETGAVWSLPVFLFPSELMFDSEQTNCHRKVLTLYNPYNYSLNFKMLCTAPSLYRVVEAEGSVRAKSCVDLVVRHLDISPRNWGRRDRFCLEVRGGGQVGQREIWAELRGGATGAGGAAGAEGAGGGRGELRRTGGQQRALSPLLVPTHTHLQLPTYTAVRGVSQWVVCVVLAVLCVTVLMLPLHTDTDSVVPPYLHVSTDQKLVCAYTLGLLTMVFLR